MRSLGRRADGTHRPDTGLPTEYALIHERLGPFDLPWSQD